MSFQTISIVQAKELIQQGQVQVADVRDSSSYLAGHITGAQRIDNSNISEYLEATDKTKPVIVCCFHGYSSQSVAQFFADQGYQQAYSLEGGYEGWKLACPELCER